MSCSRGGAGEAHPLAESLGDQDDVIGVLRRAGARLREDRPADVDRDLPVAGSSDGSAVAIPVPIP